METAMKFITMLCLSLLFTYTSSSQTSRAPDVLRGCWRGAKFDDNGPPTLNLGSEKSTFFWRLQSGTLSYPLLITPDFGSSPGRYYFHDAIHPMNPGITCDGPFHRKVNGHEALLLECIMPSENKITMLVQDVCAAPR